jgi:hypothetical protein
MTAVVAALDGGQVAATGSALVEKRGRAVPES